MDDAQLPVVPKLATRRRSVRPPRIRSFPVLPKGPRLYQQEIGSDRVSGPGEPPPGFLTFTNSRSEWTIYWALSIVLKFPENPRRGPFIGWPGLWSYQTPVDGGRAIRGGQVIDFVVESPATGNGTLAIRIQTERYHLFAPTSKQATDQVLLTRLARFSRVADIFEQDFTTDDSGQAAVLEVKRAVYGGRPSNPLRANTARRIRY